MGVVGLEWVVVMGGGTKKVDNQWLSATVSNSQQRQEQSVRSVAHAGQPLSERKCSHLRRKFAYCSFNLLPDKCDARFSVVHQKILRVYVLEKVKNIFLVIH